MAYADIFYGRRVLLIASALACLAGSAVAEEQYPSRPVEVIVPWGAGGGSDLTARMIAKYLEADLNASFPVVNAPGASGITGVQKLLLNPADGYSLGVGDDYGILGSPTAKWKLDDFIPVAVIINQAGAISSNRTADSRPGPTSKRRSAPSRTRSRSRWRVTASSTRSTRTTCWPRASSSCRALRQAQ